MSNSSSKYKTDILDLYSQNKSYKEIAKELNCSISIVQYHLSTRQQDTAKKTRKISSDKTKLSRKAGVRRNRDYVDDYLMNHPCVDCGNSDIRVLEFDHVRGVKEDHICRAIRNAWSLERLKLEIDKCEIRCCNCHRIVTINRRKLFNKL